MTLVRYKQKRNFGETPEPKGGKANGDKLRFVIQKHDASHLHYDFRLEMEGVLKSWAVPKGPSTDPAVKRLAMMVEDHPYDYRNFEGIIPSGYGAGTVIVWDEGFYEPAHSKATDKKTWNKELLQELKAGKIVFVLKGKKLKGKFALIKSHGRGENAWLLMKLEDEYAAKADILSKDKSVISKKTLKQVEKTTTNFYGSGRVKEAKGKSKKEVALSSRKDVKAAVKKNHAEKTKALPESKNNNTPEKGVKSPFPKTLKPMLATLVDKPFDEEGWIYEVKWDGYRALGFSNKGKVELKSRNDKSFDEKFYPVKEAMQEWGLDLVADGEIVVTNEKGISNFGALQNWRSEADGQLLFYVFDLLWLNGKDLTNLTLLERRDLLRPLIPEDSIIRMSENFGDTATHFFEAARKMGLEGIIAKRTDSRYHPGTRSDDWLKIKAAKRQEVVIGGYTVNDDTSKPFSSLLVGVFEKKELVYTGKIGTGFSIQTQKDMMERFKPLITDKAPFRDLPDVNKPSRFRPDPPHAEAVFLKPKLVCEVSFTEITSDGVMRHPSFQGMREDKNAIDVHPDKAKPASKMSKTALALNRSKIIVPQAKGERKTLVNPTDESQVRTINGHELTFNNLSKIFWPKEKITKRDVLNYYYRMAPYILPYLKDRPQSMNRHPNGILGKNFYQKDITGKAPEWLSSFKYHSEGDDRDKHFLVATDEASLLYMAGMGCIEMNPWNSRVQTPDRPDWCVIDLDPDKNSFDQVIQTAQVTRQILEDMGVPSYCKTSGSTGLHIYIPLGAKYSYEQSKEFARVIVTLVHRELPKITSLERVVKARGGKMYLDFLQNRPQATIATAYSLRPKPGATVSMPLHWEEVKKGLKMKDFTIFNAYERVKSEGDLFKPVLGKGINLDKIIKAFEK